MGMPITVRLVGQVEEKVFDQVFNYFRSVDKKFSPFKKNSEVSLINQQKITKSDYTKEMTEIIKLAEKTKSETLGYFDCFNQATAKFDPSGIVKGWAINNAAKILKKQGITNFFIEAGGDIQVSGKNKSGQNWQIGIRNPFNTSQIVKILNINSGGVATSGNYERGNHIYNPTGQKSSDDIVSLTVIGGNIYDADRLATAAFAMGKSGVWFIDSLAGFEAYSISKSGVATSTRGFDQFVKP